MGSGACGRIGAARAAARAAVGSARGQNVPQTAVARGAAGAAARGWRSSARLAQQRIKLGNSSHTRKFEEIVTFIYLIPHPRPRAAQHRVSAQPDSGSQFLGGDAAALWPCLLAESESDVSTGT